MRYKKSLLVSITAVIIIAFYLVTKNLTPDYLNNLGLTLPLPIFTLIIALVDGFNPCNLFVLTLLISLMLSESHSRKKIYAVGYTFIAIVYLFYFLFMAAWLNIFKYIGFIDPLRITIAIIAILAGLINCKELFFFKKGISLMIQPKHMLPLKRKINQLVKLLSKGSMQALIGSAVMLAVFASLVELPCTAGFPIIYTGILTGMGFEGTFVYYSYLLLYNLFYIMPLLVVITVLGYTFKGKPVSKSTIGVIKFIGGAIMLLLGIVLLVNPGLQLFLKTLVM
jgi:hypothetical protein